MSKYTLPLTCNQIKAIILTLSTIGFISLFFVEHTDDLQHAVHLIVVVPAFFISWIIFLFSWGIDNIGCKCNKK